MQERPIERRPRPKFGLTRRQLVRFAFFGSVAAFLGQSLGTFIAFFWPRKAGAFGGKVIAGKVEDFEIAKPIKIREGKFFISRVPDGFLALYWKCPHLGCTVPWREDEPTEDSLAGKGRFNCPCHGSIYDRYGVIIRGPAPRPMDLMKVDIVDGKVVVDTSTDAITQRQNYEPSQAKKI